MPVDFMAYKFEFNFNWVMKGVSQANRFHPCRIVSVGEILIQLSSLG